MVHAIAPEANIVLVEANLPTFADVFTAAAGWATAAKSSPAGGGGASVVSMGFVGVPGGFYGEPNYDYNFSPLSFPGVTFLAEAGDFGSINPNTELPGTTGTLQDHGAWGQGDYPADAGNVVSVGGTALEVVGINPSPFTYLSESTWNDGFEDATAGGISNFESQPAYQSVAAAQWNTSQRTTPDVSFLADADTAAVAYSSFNGGFYGASSNALSTACWSGLVAISDQIRASEGESSLAGQTQTLPILYDLYNSVAYNTDFHDIIAGGNGDFNATAGYDLVTGIGTPIANNMVPDLANLQQMLYASPSGTNNYVLKESAGVLYLTDNGIQVAYQPLSITTSIDIGGGGTVADPADNSLTIDYSGGQFTVPVSFDGGLGSSPHTLTLENGTYAKATYNLTGAGSGNVSIDGETISYTNATLVADRTVHPVEIINLPVGAQASLQNDNDYAFIPGLSEVTSLNAGFVTTVFTDPANSFTVNTVGGPSLVQLNLMNSAFDPVQETFNGQAADVYQFIAEAAIQANTNLAINTATLDLKGLNPTVNALTGNGIITTSVSGSSGVVTFTVGSAGGSGTFSGKMLFTIGEFSFRKDGAGTEILTGNSSFTGLTTVIGGVLKDGVANALPSGTFMTVMAYYPSQAPGTFDLNGFSQQVANLNGTGTVTDSGAAATFTITESAADVFLGLLTGSLSLVDSGTGTLTLDSENTYTGSTTISGGTLFDGILNTLPIGTALTVTSPGTLDLNGFNQQVASVAGSGTVTDSGAAATFTVNNGSADLFVGLLTGNLSLVKIGSGTLTLTSANTYGGSTTITAGTIADGTTNALPIGTNLFIYGPATDPKDNGELDLTNFNQQVASVTGTGTVISSAGTVETFTVTNVGADTFNGLLTGNIGLTENGGGTLTLTSQNTYSGPTNIGPGTLVAGIAFTLPVGTNLIVTGTFDMAGFNQQVANVTGTGTVTDTGTLANFTVNNSAADIFVGNLTGSLALIKSSSGKLTLTSANTYSGATTITKGILADGVINALPIGTALSDGGTLDLAGFSQQVAGVTGIGTVSDSGATTTFTVNNSAADTFGGQLTGGLALAKTNSGTLQLTNINSYAGSTSVSAGTLEVDGSIISAVTLSGTGTLDGTGSTGPVTATAGTLAPGTSTPGILTTGTLNLQPGSAFNVLIGGNSPGSYSQDIVSSGSVTLGNSGSAGVALNFAASSYTPKIGDDYIIISNAGSFLTGTFVAGTGDDYVAPGTTLGEGAVLSTNFLGSGYTATITYVAGANHDSVGIKITPTITVTYSPPSQSITTHGPITYSVTYSDSVSFVSNLQNSDITLNSTDSASGTVSVSGTGPNYTVTISAITGDGSLSISIAANTASDAFGGVALATGPSTSFIVDNTPPSEVIGSPSASITAHGPITYTVSYVDENFGSSDLVSAAIILNHTGTANGVVSVTGSGTSYLVSLSSITGDGTLGISIPPDTAIDQAGNLAIGAGPSTTFTVDNTPPAVNISNPSAPITAHGSITYTVTYSDAHFASSSLSTGNITLNTSGTATGVVGVSGSGLSYIVTISSIAGDGTLGISIAGNTASDQAGNQALATGPSTTFIVDNTPPSVTISSPSSPITATGTIIYTVTYADANFGTSDLTNSSIVLNKTGTANAGIVSVSGSGTSYAVIIGSITGNGTLSISIAANTAIDQAGNLALAAGPSTPFTVDNTLPVVTITGPSQSITTSAAVTYTVTYTDANFGSSSLVASNIFLNKTGTANGSIGVSGSGNSYIVTIGGISGDGTLGITLAANTAVDQAGNGAPAAGPSSTFIVDNTAPSVTIGSPSNSITASAPITYTITYADANFGSSSLTTRNITLNKSGTANGNLSLTGSGKSYTVTVSNITGDGNLGISIGANTAVDLAGNEALATGFSSTFIVDNTPPSVTISSPSNSIAARGSITYTINYADANFASSSLTTSAITLNTTGTANGSISLTGTGTGSTYTVTVGNISGDGTLGISVGANTAVDLAGNLALSAGPSATFTVDDTAPVVTIGNPSSPIASSGPITYTVSFSDANFGSSNLTANFITLNATGTANGVVSVTGSGTSYTVMIGSITGNGALGISVAANAAVDLAGNEAPAAGPSSTVIVDNTLPTLSISGPSKAITSTGAVNYTINYADANFGSSSLTPAAITLNTTGTATGSVSVSGSGKSYLVTIGSISGDGTLGISIAGDTAVDLAGNQAPAVGPSQTFAVDNTPPSVTIGNPSFSLTSNGPITYAITYSDANFGSSNLTAAGITLNTTGTAAGSVSVLGAGTSYTVTISQITGDGTLGISVAAGTAIDQVGNQSLVSTPSKTFNVDNTPPSVTIGNPSTSITSHGPISYSVVYADANFGSSDLTPGDIILNSFGTATGTVSVIRNTSTTYTVTISNITGDGTLGFSIDAGTAVDQAGNLAPVSAPSTAVTVDNTAPTILLFNPSSSYTGQGPVSYEVSYLDANFQSSSLSTSNVHLISTGTAKGSLSFDTSTGSTRIVTISNISGDGTLGISIDSGSAVDQAGNKAAASGRSATFIVDNTAPVVTISAPSVKTTVSGSVKYTVTYQDTYLNTNSISLSPASIQLITTNPGQSANITVTGFGNTRTVTLSQITGGKGAMGIQILAGTATDQAGNSANATRPSVLFSVTGAPKLKMTSNVAASVAPGGTLTYTFIITNTGTQPAVGVSFLQVPPAATSVNLANNPGWTPESNGYIYTLGTLAAGFSTTVTFTVNVPSTAKLNSTLVDAMYVLDSIGTEAATTLKTTVAKVGRRS